MGAYCLYVTFGATPKAGQKTSKTVDLFNSEALEALSELTVLHVVQPPPSDMDHKEVHARLAQDKFVCCMA
jgi:hypothetical protein